MVTSHQAKEMMTVKRNSRARPALTDRPAFWRPALGILALAPLLAACASGGEAPAPAPAQTSAPVSTSAPSSSPVTPPPLQLSLRLP